MKFEPTGRTFGGGAARPTVAIGAPRPATPDQSTDSPADESDAESGAATSHAGADADPAADLGSSFPGAAAEDAAAVDAELAQDPEVLKAAAPFSDGITADFEALNEPAESRAAMMGWLNEFAAGTLPPAGDHPFDLSKWRGTLRSEHFAMLESAATAMGAAGASQGALDSAVRRFLDLRSAQTRGPLARALASAYARRARS